jgi:hypothetical protein
MLPAQAKMPTQEQFAPPCPETRHFFGLKSKAKIPHHLFSKGQVTAQQLRLCQDD